MQIVLAISQGLWIQLLGPPVMCLLVLFMAINMMRSLTPDRKLDPFARDMLKYTLPVVLVIMYGLVSLDQLVPLFQRWPLSSTFVLVGLFLAWLWLLVNRGRALDQQAREQLAAAAAAGVRPRSVSLGLRIWQGIVIVWRLLGLLGGLIAVLRFLFKKS